MAEVTTDLAVRLAEPVGMVRNLLAQKTSDAIALVGAEEDDWPPCMRKAVADLSAGVNVNHFGRLFLASMASTLALPQEACVDFFRGAPDFDEGTTTYQVGHVYQHGTRLPDVENSRSITTVQSYQVTIVYATNLGSITLSSTSALRSGGNIVSNRQKHLKSQLKNPPMKQEFEVEECLPSNREHHATDSRIDC